MFTSPTSPTATCPAYSLDERRPRRARPRRGVAHVHTGDGVGHVAAGAAASTDGARPAAARSRPSAPSAVPDAIASQCPRSPHAQSGPSGSTWKCPISAAEAVRAAQHPPAVTMPPPTPVPRVISSTSRLPARRAVGELGRHRDVGVVVDDDREPDRGFQALRAPVRRRNAGHVG